MMESRLMFRILRNLLGVANKKSLRKTNRFFKNVKMNFDALEERSVPALVVPVTPGTETPTVNDFTQIANAVAAATNGTTIQLSGTFHWEETNAMNSWAAAGYEIHMPGLDNLTITAASLGAARIQGPGDVAAVNLESVFH